MEVDGGSLKLKLSFCFHKKILPNEYPSNYQALWGAFDANLNVLFQSRQIYKEIGQPFRKVEESKPITLTGERTLYERISLRFDDLHGI